MYKLKVTSNLKALSRKLYVLKKQILEYAEITLEFAAIYVTPTMLVMLTSWALEMRLRNIRFIVTGYTDTLFYLDRMGFQEAIGATPLYIPKLPEAGRFIPLSILHDPGDQFVAVNNVCELVMKQFTNARSLLPAFEWAVCEITDNVFIHSKSKTPCVLAAQYYPMSKQLEIAMADQGVGYLGTLGPVYGAKNDYEAMELALTRGLTRDTAIGQGNGLAGTEAIVDGNNGELFIWTGNTSMTRSEERVYSKFVNPNGVGVALRLRVDTPVDLGSIWIGERPYTYIDQCVNNIENGSVISVASECNSVGSREPARRLRNKLLALLPDIETNLVLDFSKCSSPSSSFFDELFGRLILEIGIKEYSEKIEITGLDKADFDIANVVIHQRLEPHSIY
jgi:hypothetical protein